MHAAQRFRVRVPGPVETIESHEGEAYHRHDEAARHIELIGYVAHEFGQDGASHDGHDDEGGSSFRPSAEAEDSESKDGREHDRHEEVAEEHAYHGQPAELQEDQERHGNVAESIDAQHRSEER